MLGSLAALVVAFISFMAQVSPSACVMRSAAAFAVFAAFGIVIRYLLTDAAINAAQNVEEARDDARQSARQRLEEIVPGTPVGDLLGEEDPVALTED